MFFLIYYKNIFNSPPVHRGGTGGKRGVREVGSGGTEEGRGRRRVGVREALGREKTEIFLAESPPSGRKTEAENQRIAGIKVCYKFAIVFPWQHNKKTTRTFLLIKN